MAIDTEKTSEILADAMREDSRLQGVIEDLRPRSVSEMRNDFDTNINFVAPTNTPPKSIDGPLRQR